MPTTTDLDVFTTPNNPFDYGQERFGPFAHGPAGVGNRIILSTGRTGPTGIAQVLFDTTSGRSWIRTQAAPGAPWAAWVQPSGGGVNPNPPVLVTASMVNDERIALLHFDLQLDTSAGAKPAPADFVVKVKGVTKPVTSVAVSGSDVALDMGDRFASGPITVSYTPGTNKLKSIDGVEVAAFTDLSVSVAAPQGPPVQTAANLTTGKTVVEITFSLPLDEGIVPANSAFIVQVGVGMPATVNTVAVTGSLVKLTLDAAYSLTPVKVSYTQPGTNKLVGENGVHVASFSNFDVTVPAADESEPEPQQQPAEPPPE